MWWYRFRWTFIGIHCIVSVIGIVDRVGCAFLFAFACALITRRCPSPITVHCGGTVFVLLIVVISFVFASVVTHLHPALLHLLRHLHLHKPFDGNFTVVIATHSHRIVAFASAFAPAQTI